MSDIKVTDKRMFTPDGRLREEFEAEVSEAAEATETPEATSSPAPEPSPRPEPEPEPDAVPAEDSVPSFADGELGGGPSLELPGTPSALGAPSFYDLVGALAEPASIYLGDVPLPDGASAENLEAARFHIDLLDLLRKRTAGNLAAQELAVLEDVLYRLRVRYVQKRG
ncbi:MAG: DUF1844 domain-containing protein [Acidobacteria bacterium]|nr:DUF1844 domain-containing protein [Acidobacteriota bacterium]